MENQTSDVDMTSSQIREQSLATKWVILQRFDKCWAKNKNKIKNPIKATYISRYTHVTRLGVPPTDHYPVSIYENIRNFEYLKFRLFFFFWWKLRRLTCVIFILFKLPVGVRLVWGGERGWETGGRGGGGFGGREKCTSVTMWLLPKPRRRNAQTEQRALWSVRFGGFLSTLPPPLGTNTPYTPLTQSKQRAEKTPSASARFLKVGGKNKKKNRRCECLPCTTTPLTYPQVL